MASIPYMPLYIADYLSDTVGLTPLEHGIYLLLIMHYWQTGKPLPNDDLYLSKVALTHRLTWGKVKVNLLRYFEVRGGKLYHKRIEKELDKFRSKSSACKYAADKRWGNIPTNDHDANALRTHCERNPNRTEQIRTDKEEQSREEIPLNSPARASLERKQNSGALPISELENKFLNLFTDLGLTMQLAGDLKAITTARAFIQAGVTPVEAREALQVKLKAYRGNRTPHPAYFKQAVLDYKAELEELKKPGVSKPRKLTARERAEIWAREEDERQRNEELRNNETA